MTPAKRTELAPAVVVQDDCVEARSSVGEHYLDAVGVSGSIPLVPTGTVDLSSSELFQGDVGCFLKRSLANPKPAFPLDRHA